MRMGILAAVVLSSTIGLMPPALAQMTPQEHEEEPPPSQEPRAGMQDSSSGPMPGMMEETMQGPSPGMSMSQMMRGPRSTEFYPTLIRISEPDPVERDAVARLVGSIADVESAIKARETLKRWFSRFVFTSSWRLGCTCFLACTCGRASTSA